MKLFLFKKHIPLILIFLCLAITQMSYSEENAASSPSERVKQYSNIIESSSSDTEIANAHYEIGIALEEMGRNTEATAEYLKVVINYPDEKEVNEKVDSRLRNLYSEFDKKAEEFTFGEEQPGAQKDPAIFFAYIKSLYENYRNQAQYDKAINVLTQLYDMDPDNSLYLVNMGEIYLHGYGDIDKAIFHFNKAIELGAEKTRSYAGVGRAYEKKGDYDNAVKFYRKAGEISPTSPWAIYGLRRIEAIILSAEKKLVKDWYFIGPFDNSDGEGLEKVFPPEEGIDLETEYKDKEGVAVKWFRPFSYDSSGYVDMNLLFKLNDYSVGYALTYVYSPNEKDVKIRFGAEDGLKIWINDKEIATFEIARSSEVDSDSLDAHLNKGWNKILLKVSDTWGGWGFYFRITDLKGNFQEDLIFDPIKNEDRLKYIYGKLVREKRFRVTKIVAIYALAVTAFLLGLYFMVHNILSKIKINRMKEDFISSVSHELKTPIAAVRMLAETLKRGKVKEESRKNQYYEMIMRESDRLTRFINKILDFARIEKGGKIFYFEKSDIKDLLKTALDIYKDEAQDENLKLSLNSEPGDVYADIDKDAIIQVVLNLMDNAYKYSKEEKTITLTLRKSDKNIFIEVQDKGIGIPKEDVEKVFDKFYRVDKYSTGKVKGSGLGLPFVKSVIDAHSGKIALESELGKGTKFIISLPTERI